MCMPTDCARQTHTVTELMTHTVLPCLQIDGIKGNQSAAVKWAPKGSARANPQFQSHKSNQRLAQPLQAKDPALQRGQGGHAEGPKADSLHQGQPAADQALPTGQTANAERPEHAPKRAQKLQAHRHDTDPGQPASDKHAHRGQSAQAQGVETDARVVGTALEEAAAMRDSANDSEWLAIAQNVLDAKQMQAGPNFTAPQVSP